MKNSTRSIKYGLLAGSLCLWLCCAWIAQQPAPARRPQPKPVKTKQVPTPVVKKAAQPAVNTAPTGNTSVVVAKSSERQLDPESGLVLDETMPIVKGQCTACHSSKLILQSHFDRDKWIERIRWMQRTQKLWDLGETEKPILDYLTKYYGPLETPFDGRRLPLSAPTWHKS